MTVFGGHGAVPASVSELVLTLLDGQACGTGDGHRGAGVLGDEFELSASEWVNWRCEEQVGLSAQRV